MDRVTGPVTRTEDELDNGSEPGRVKSPARARRDVDRIRLLVAAASLKTTPGMTLSEAVQAVRAIQNMG